MKCETLQVSDVRTLKLTFYYLDKLYLLFVSLNPVFYDFLSNSSIIATDGE